MAETTPPRSMTPQVGVAATRTGAARTATKPAHQARDAGEQTLTVVTDADTAIPAAIRRDLPLILAPPDAAMLDPQEEPRDLRAMQGIAPLAPVAEACLAAAARGPVLYVGSGDGYSAAASAVDDLATLMHERRPETPFRAINSGSTLMGCGWQAIAAGIVARRPGATLDAAAAAAATVGRSVEVRAMLEYPQFMELNQSLSKQLLGARAIVRLQGTTADVIDRPLKRAGALAAFCDLIAEHSAGQGLLRVAIHHGGVEPAAQALAQWVQRTLDPEELEVTSLTRHAATRIGPGSLTVAWYRAPE